MEKTYSQSAADYASGPGANDALKKCKELEKRIAYLEGVVTTLISRIDELENNFNEYVDEELIEKLDFHR